MCVHCKAASAILDMLWEDPRVRDEFSRLGVDLSTLGSLTHEVFAPAYRRFKKNLDAAALSMLDADVVQDVLKPHYEKDTFREAWDDWGDATRSGFVQENSEVKLAELLMRFYNDEFFEAYRSAYVVYRAQQTARQ
jgi:hypothetical protein